MSYKAGKLSKSSKSDYVCHVMLEKNSQQALEAFCNHPDNQSIFQSPTYIRGLLFAVCSAPEIPMPEHWFPWVVAQSGDIQSAQVNRVSNILIQLLKEQLQAMHNEQVHLPADCHYGEHTEALEQWMTGLTAGHSLLEKVWQNAWQEMLNKQPEQSQSFATDLTRCIRMFSTFANTDLATTQALERGNDDFKSKLPVLAKSLSGTLKEYVKLSGDLVNFLPNQFETFQEKLPKIH